MASEEQLTVSEEESGGGTWTVAARGDLDLRTAPDLCARLGAHRGHRVVADLTEVRFCDSSGLRALVGEASETRYAGGRLTVVAPEGGAVRRLLELTGLTELLQVRPDRERALASA
jgi:anti-anti-sigma factor